MKLPSEAEFIRATQTPSYRLAEAAQKNLRAQVKIPDYLREFEAVFAKDSFDTLPVRANLGDTADPSRVLTRGNPKIYQK